MHLFQLLLQLLQLLRQLLLAQPVVGLRLKLAQRQLGDEAVPSVLRLLLLRRAQRSLPPARPLRHDGRRLDRRVVALAEKAHHMSRARARRRRHLRAQTCAQPVGARVRRGAA